MPKDNLDSRNVNLVPKLVCTRNMIDIFSSNTLFLKINCKLYLYNIENSAFYLHGIPHYLYSSISAVQPFSVCNIPFLPGKIHFKLVNKISTSMQLLCLCS